MRTVIPLEKLQVKKKKNEKKEEAKRKSINIIHMF